MAKRKSKSKGGSGLAILLAPVLIVLAIPIAFLITVLTNHTYSNDLSIITKEGHPRFFDRTETAKKFWKEYLDYEVILPDSNCRSNNERVAKSIVNITGYGTSDKRLDYISLYISNTDVQSISLEEALNIVRDYLPIGLNKEDYEFVDSFILKKEENNRKYFVRIIEYKISDVGYQKRENTKEAVGSLGKTYSMPYSIYVHFWGDDSIGWIEIRQDLNKNLRQYSYSNSGWEKIEWHYDYME